jgi:hypothetical protein
LRGEAAHKILAYPTNLDCGFGGLFFPNSDTEEFRFPEHNRIAKHHFNLHVGHFKMKPSNSSDAITSKNETMEKIFFEITERIGARTTRPYF